MEAINNLGICKQKTGNINEAEQLFLKALQLNSNFESALYNLANIYKESCETEKAQTYYQKVLALNPEHAQAIAGLGVCYTLNGEPDQAYEYYVKALKIAPNDDSIKYNLAAYYLGKGKLSEAWPLYHSRNLEKHRLAIDVSQLNPNKLKDKRILLTREQGIGDEIFFLRYLENLAQYTSSIDYLANPKLAELITQLPHINKVHSEDCTLGEYDFIISVADLPLLMQQDNDFPASIHLKPENRHLERAAALLKQAGPPPYIGLTWRAGQQVKGLLYKEAPLADLMTTLQSNSGTFVILQRNPLPEDFETLGNFASRHAMLDLSSANDDLPFMLAVLQQIDHYVGVSNTNMHLMAALGKTADVLVTFPPEWRWCFEVEQSPWFTGFNLFRQDPHYDWSTAFNKLEQHLTKHESKYA